MTDEMGADLATKAPWTGTPRKDGLSEPWSVQVNSSGLFVFFARVFVLVLVLEGCVVNEDVYSDVGIDTPAC